MADANAAELFAEQAKIVFKLPLGTSRLVLACGNEAGDLDTIVSAVAAAYLVGKKIESPPVSVVPFSRCDFRLHLDAKRLFEDAGFSLQTDETPRALTFWDEVPWSSLPRNSDGNLCAEMILTDHNAMSDSMKRVGIVHIINIFDHHKDTGLYLDAERNIDSSVGSCCTLLAEAFDVNVIPRDLGILLLGTILVDTRNFDPEAQRFNERDKLAVAKLQGFLPEHVATEAFAAGVHPHAWWSQKLLDSRYDISGLSLQDLLKLDYKKAILSDTGMRIGFSAVFTSLHDLIDRAGNAEAAQHEVIQYGRHCKLDVLISMTKSAEVEGVGKVKGLVISAITQEGSETAQIIERYLSMLPEALPEHLQEVPLFTTQEVTSKGIVVGQVNLSPLLGFWNRPLVTRKTLMPAVMDYLNSLGSSTEVDSEPLMQNTPQNH